MADRIDNLNDLFLKLRNDSRLARVAGDLERLAERAIRLNSFLVDEKVLAMGATRLGDKPDLPKDFVWPEWNGRPLNFVAQLNLKDFADNANANRLPQEGWLCFFYDTKETPWGFDPNDRGGWVVAYIRNEAESIERREIPAKILEEDEVYACCSITQFDVVTLPDWMSLPIERLSLDESEREAYWELLETLNQDEPCHQILGYPKQQQGEMQLECQLASNGIYLGGTGGRESPQAQELESGADDWQLLFQLDSDDNTGMMWGDAGMLYFWIRRQDLSSQAFDKVWMVLQCG